MGLPALYYMGRENPPHPEIWITYFLRMMELYSNKVCELSMETNKQSEQVNLSYLNKKDKELLAYLIENKMYEFKPVDVAGALKVTNKTVINRCGKLYSNGFVVPVITIFKCVYCNYLIMNNCRYNKWMVISCINILNKFI